MPTPGPRSQRRRSAWTLANRGGRGQNSGRGGKQYLIDSIQRAVASFIYTGDGGRRWIRPGTARRVTYVLLDDGDEQTAQFATKDDLDEAVGATITTMRDAGLLDPAFILDGRSTVEEPTPTPGPREYVDRLLERLDDGYRHDRQDRQDRLIVVWTEAADTLPGLREVADTYGCTLISSSGTNTDQARMRLGRLMAEQQRPATVLYVGDYDPPGVAMERLIPNATETWAAREYQRWLGCSYREACETYPRRLPGEDWHDTGKVPPPWAEVEVVRVAVTRDDLNGRLTAPVKAEALGQYARFWPRGETRTLQVEALSIEEVEARVEDAIRARLDLDTYGEVVADEDEPRELLRQRLSALRDELPEAAEE